MKRFLKWGLIGLAALMVIGTVLLWTPDADRDEIIAKYSNAESEFVTAPDGAKIHFRDQGNADGQVLVLLHGSNASLHTWEDMIRELKADYRLISLDFPGHGLTGPDPERDYSAASMIDAVIAVMDQAGVEKAVITGNSMGGWLSWRMALSHPERVSGLVLIDASGVVGVEEPDLYLAAKIQNTKLGQMLATKMMPKPIVKKTLSQVMFDDTQITDQLINRYYDLARFPGNRQAGNDRMNTPREPDYYARIGQIEVPVLILWGQHDVTTPLSYAQAFDEALPESEKIIYPNAAHLPMEEIPQAVARDIDRWHGVKFSEIKKTEN